MLIALTRDFLFVLHAEPDGSGFRLASIRLKDPVGSSSINPGDWPSYQVPGDIEARGAYSYIILPFKATKDEPTLDDVEPGMTVRVSSWSRSPNTRLSVTLRVFDRVERGMFVDSRCTIFDIGFLLDDSGKGAFTVLHEYHHDCDLNFYDFTPLGIRSLVGEEQYLPYTFAVGFDDNGALCNRINDLEFFPAEADEDDILSVKIDPLGRMVVYKLTSESQAKYIGVIRFD